MIGVAANADGAAGPNSIVSAPSDAATNVATRASPWWAAGCTSSSPGERASMLAWSSPVDIGYSIAQNLKRAALASIGTSTNSMPTRQRLVIERRARAHETIRRNRGRRPDLVGQADRHPHAFPDLELTDMAKGNTVHCQIDGGDRVIVDRRREVEVDAEVRSSLLSSDDHLKHIDHRDHCHEAGSENRNTLSGRELR